MNNNLMGMIIPKEIAIDVASVCNAKCPFCTHEIIKFKNEPRPTKVMSLETYSVILEQAKQAGIKYLRLYWWGEPTLNSNLNAFIKMAKKDFYILLSTNAERMDNFFESLLDVNLLRYSIDGWDKSSFDTYRFPLSFDKVYDNVRSFYSLRNARGKKPTIKINCVVMPDTDFEAYWKLWGGATLMR